MDREAARQQVLNRMKRKRAGRLGTKAMKVPVNNMSMADKFRLEQRRRLMNKKRDNLPGGMLTGGQAKIAAKAPPPNKIDAKDFAVLRAEKAKGRGQGLQDEKLKPGKVTKAALGILAAGLGAKMRMKDKKKAPVGMAALGAGAMKMDLIKKLLGKKTGGVMKASTGRAIQSPTRGLGRTANQMTPEGLKKTKEKILMDRYKKKRKELRNKPKTPLGGNMKKPKPGSQSYQFQQTQNTRPSQILPKKKMGGVMKYDKGGMGEAKGYKKYLEGLKKAEGAQFRAKFKAKEIAKAGGKAALRAAKASKFGKIALGVAGIGLAAKEFLQRKIEKRKRIKREKTAVRTLKADMAVQKLKESLPKKMGGGMMQRPIMASKGKSVKVKCKLGRNKPTKMY